MTVSLSIPEIFYLFAAFHGVLLALLISARKNQSSNRYLVMLIGLFSFYLVENVIYSSGYLVKLPHLFFTTLPLIYLIGPLFYTYIRSSVHPNFRLRSFDLLHLGPFFFELSILIPFYLLPAEVKIKIFEASQQVNENPRFSIYYVGYLVYIGSIIYYFFASFQLLQKSPTPQTKKAKKSMIWLRQASTGFFSYAFLGLIMSLLVRVYPDMTMSYFHINLTFLTLLIHGIGYVAFFAPDLFSAPEQTNQYEFSALGSAYMGRLKEDLEKVMTDQQLFLNPELSAEDVSRNLNITKHQLSQLLSQGMSTSFYDYINSFRIQHAKTLLISHSQDKVLKVALESGFSNKASFLRNFKKATGLTPTTYREENLVSFN